jgi:hypothetical protein
MSDQENDQKKTREESEYAVTVAATTSNHAAGRLNVVYCF